MIVCPSVPQLPSVRFGLGLRWGVGFGDCFGGFGSLFESAQWQDAESRGVPLQHQYSWEPKGDTSRPSRPYLLGSRLVTCRICLVEGGGHKNDLMVVCNYVGMLVMEHCYISWKLRGLVALALLRGAGKFQHPCTHTSMLPGPRIQSPLY